MEGTGTVATVTGPIAPAELGGTLVREHIIASFVTPDDSPEGWRSVGRRQPAAAGERHFYEKPLTMGMLGAASLGAPNRDNESLADEAVARKELHEFARHGGRTIVDATAAGLGRDPAALQRLAQAVPVNIVMGAGWYHPAWSPGISGRSSDSLAAEIVQELRGGIDGVRAGMIGALGPLDPSIPAERNLLLAAAAAACATGAPLCLDSPDETGVRDAALKLLISEGVAPASIALGGCGGTALDLDGLQKLLDRGIYVQFDRLGRIPSIYTRVADHDVAVAVLELARRGYGNRVLLSQSVSRKCELKSYGGNGYAFLPEQFMGYLANLGADESLLRNLTTGNPRRFLTGNPQEPA